MVTTSCPLGLQPTSAEQDPVSSNVFLFLSLCLTLGLASVGSGVGNQVNPDNVYAAAKTGGNMHNVLPNVQTVT